MGGQQVGRWQSTAMAIAFFGKHALRAFPRALGYVRGASDEQGSWIPVVLLFWTFMAATWPGLFADFDSSTGSNQAGLVGTLMAWWAEHQPKVFAVVCAGAYARAFFAGVWEEVQRDRDRASDLEERARDTGISIDALSLAWSVRREYEPSTGGLTGPIVGYEFCMSDVRILTSREPVALSFRLSLPTTGVAPATDVVMYLLDPSERRPSGQQWRVSIDAFTDCSIFLIGLLSDKRANDAWLRSIDVSAVRVRAFDSRNPERHVSFPVPGQGRL